jgi:hypothetical protein
MFIFLCSWTTLLEQLTKRIDDFKTSTHTQTMYSLITLSVHCRDVIKELVDEGVTSTTDFNWQKNIRYEWDAFVS